MAEKWNDTASKSRYIHDSFLGQVVARGGHPHAATCNFSEELSYPVSPLQPAYVWGLRCRVSGVWGFLTLESLIQIDCHHFCTSLHVSEMSMRRAFSVHRYGWKLKSWTRLIGTAEYVHKQSLCTHAYLTCEWSFFYPSDTLKWNTFHHWNFPILRPILETFFHRAWHTAANLSQG